MTITVNQTYYLEVNSVPLACAAWRVLDPAVAWDESALRGGDRVLPGASGRRALVRVRDSVVQTYGLEVLGNYETDGTVSTNPARTLMTHMAYLKANLGYAKSTGDGTVTVKFYRGAEATLTTTAHFLGFKGSQLKPPAFLTTTFDISIPSGVWS